MNDEQKPNDPNLTDDDADRFAPSDDAVPMLPSLDDDDLADLDALARELEVGGMTADNMLGKSEPTVSMSSTVSMPSAPPDMDDDTLFDMDDDDAPPMHYEPLPDVDVEGALSAVSDGLEAVVARHEAEVQLQQDEAERIESVLNNPMALPEPLTLERGSLPTLIPALALVGLGAWLTFVNTTGSAPSGNVIGAALVGLFALGLLLTWLSTRRWNRGALFLSLTGFFGALGSIYLLEQFGLWALPSAIVLALGGAFTLSGLFARPFRMSVILPGLMLLVAGAVTLVHGLGLIPSAVNDILRTGWVVVAAIVALVVFLPLIQRIRG